MEEGHCTILCEYSLLCILEEWRISGIAEDRFEWILTNGTVGQLSQPHMDDQQERFLHNFNVEYDIQYNIELQD